MPRPNRLAVVLLLLSATFSSAADDVWQRYLVPITDTQVPGANGSLWRTDLTMLFRADQQLTIDPDPCNVPITCIYQNPPLRRPFDAHEYGFALPNRGGQFLHVFGDHDASFAMNGRFYDESRLQETAGTELPIVRVEEFRTDGVVLLNIPVAPQYRHTLRIYDGDGRETRVAIRVFAGDETTPRLSITRDLVPFHPTAPPANPRYPAYDELALGQLLALEGVDDLRIEVDPLTEGSRIWAFVSITNNDTHHVTLVSAQ